MNPPTVSAEAPTACPSNPMEPARHIQTSDDGLEVVAMWEWTSGWVEIPVAVRKAR